jgi:copper chaperone CopZ
MRQTYQIEGMHCSTCVEKIKKALSTKFKDVEVSLDPPLLQIEVEKSPSLTELNTLLGLVGNYQVQPFHKNVEVKPNEENKNIWTYYPIFLITVYIAGVALINNYHWEGMHWQSFMNHFMAGFFLVFSAFKFLDIRGFADGYATYDLLARQWYPYGYIYPFLELGLGILYLGAWFLTLTQIITVILMGFSTLGVINRGCLQFT